MGALWFWIVALMLAAYVVFDGFDLGVGAIYLLVAREESERSQVLRSIGPVWDGNEVWLLAAGGTLFFAFPLLYATAFSGFYLPLMMVLWLIILRGVSIELRGHSTDSLWRTFFGGVFCIASTLLAIFFGVALGNVVRGVPIGSDGYFFLPLWTDLRTGANPGILDWYTVLAGLLALSALSLHGALYLILKTQGSLAERAVALAKRTWVSTILLSVLGIPATIVARPASFTDYLRHPIAFIFPAAAFLSLVATRYFVARRSELASFLSSCSYLASMFLGAAFGLFPVLLPTTTGDGRDITLEKALTGMHTLRIGLIWWSLGICLAIMYFVLVYRMFGGKVSTAVSTDEHR